MTKLDTCWKNCLRMWKWVSENWESNRVEGGDTTSLKAEWLKKHRYGSLGFHDCFFCDYASEESMGSYDPVCYNCPGMAVQPRFKSLWCQNGNWHWYSRPKAFYAKLLQLDAKRRGK